MTRVALDVARRRLTGLIPESILADDHEVRTRHAHAVWSCLTEPGDAVAGAAVAALGAVEALEILLSAGPQPPDAAWRAGVRRWAPRWATLDDAFDRARRSGARLLTPADATWPAGFADLGVHGPQCLWVRGASAALTGSSGSAALVGARAATSYGEHVTAELSAGVVAAGVTVVSGGAYGIDGSAHRAVLAVGGITVAILAGGVDRPYPAGHAALLERIVDHGGAIAAEVPCGTSPTKWRFLQRNRLIAASADATVVVEAGWRSGSLNTAGHAAALGRPLGAVPGPVTSAASAGCHRLLREYDARCVTCAEDIGELLGHSIRDGAPRGDHIDERTRIRDALSARSARTPADIARRAGFSEVEVQELLGLLELEGEAVRTVSGWRRRSAT